MKREPLDTVKRHKLQSDKIKIILAVMPEKSESRSYGGLPYNPYDPIIGGKYPLGVSHKTNKVL